MNVCVIQVDYFSLEILDNIILIIKLRLFDSKKKIFMLNHFIKILREHLNLFV